MVSPRIGGQGGGLVVTELDSMERSIDRSYSL
jgi:hypothetical protein